MGELHSQSESNLDEYCEAITLGSEKQGDNQLDCGNYMEVTNEIEAPNAVKFVSQLEEAEKMEQELPKVEKLLEGVRLYEQAIEYIEDDLTDAIRDNVV
ncbi:hypothetical protein ACLOJK_024329 [Asimina triloba]